MTFTCDRRRLGHRRGRRLRPATPTLANEGADQSVQGDAQDVAGNTSSHRRSTRSTSTRPPDPDRCADQRRQRRRLVQAATSPSRGPATTACRASTRPPSRPTARSPARAATSAPVRRRSRTRPATQGTGVGHRHQDRPHRARRSPAACRPAANAAGWYQRRRRRSTSPAPTRPWPTARRLRRGHLPDRRDVSRRRRQPERHQRRRPPTSPATPAPEDGRPASTSTARPQTTADNQCTATNGYCTGGTADGGADRHRRRPVRRQGDPLHRQRRRRAGRGRREHDGQRPADGTGSGDREVLRGRRRRQRRADQHGRAQVRQHRPDGDPHGQPEGERGGLEQQRRHGPLRRQGHRPGLRRRRRQRHRRTR